MDGLTLICFVSACSLPHKLFTEIAPEPLDTRDLQHGLVCKKQNAKHSMEKLCEKQKQHHSSMMSLLR